MYECVNPQHVDKQADRIAGAIVDLAYSKNENPHAAVEVLLGHGKCHIINETDTHLTKKEVKNVVKRIAGNLKLDYKEVPQDIHLAKNQSKEVRCGDNGIFKGVPVSKEQRELTKIAKNIYKKYPYDGKYILDDGKLIICQSNAPTEELREMYPDAIINPLGEWTGGSNVDSGATNRKLGSDMGDSITGGGLCLSGNSEYLGDDLKWHQIKDYSNGKVGQWNNGKLEFVAPIKYIHNTSDELIHIFNNSKLSMCLTPNHEMLIKTSKGHLIKKPAQLIADKLNKQIGNSGSILHSFMYEHKTKKTIYADENDYRLQVAFCADGSILKNCKKWNGRIRVKKECKKQRLRELLNTKQYLETRDGEYSIFWYKFTKESKSLRECFVNENWDILKEEIFYWDGNNNLKLFRTTKKEDADFIQLVLQSYGYAVGIYENNRIGHIREVAKKKYIDKSILYTVKVYKSTKTQLRKSKSTPIHVEYLPEKKDSFCFEVPSHNLIIRHNNKIFITGNCGKECSKADVSINIYVFAKAQMLKRTVTASCAIGDTEVLINLGKGQFETVPYTTIVEFAKQYIRNLGGFEKFAEWGLIR